jgi:hypothetical protein
MPFSDRAAHVVGRSGGRPCDSICVTALVRLSRGTRDRHVISRLACVLCI